MEKRMIDPIRVAIALGFTCGLGALFLGAAAYYLGWGTEAVDMIGSVYRGYTPTPGGALIGTGWAFVDGFVGGWLFAWIYNKV